MSDGSHLSDLDLDIQSQSSPNDALDALWSNGHTMFVLDRFDDRVYAYSMSDSSRDSAREISLVSANGNAEGMWFDGRVLWVSDYTDDYLYAYHLPGATSSVTLWEDTSLSTSEHTANTRYDADLGEPKPTFVVDGVRYTLDSIRQLHSPPRSPKLAMTIKPLVPSSERSALGFVSDGMEYSPSDVDQFINSAAATEIVWIIPSITWIKGGTTSAALRLYGNTPAEGNVVIGGVPELGGGALEADVSGITDAEGLSADAFHYQWVRVTGITVVDLPGADDSTYTPSKADEYSKLQVRVVFNDLAGFQEYPKTSALVGPPAGCGNDTCRLLTRYPGFDLHAPHSPTSLWSDGSTLWVGNDGAPPMVRGYRLYDDPDTANTNEYGTRDTSKDLPGVIEEDHHVTGHGDYLYTSKFSAGTPGSDDAWVYAWNMSDLTRAPSRDFKFREDGKPIKIILTRGIETDGRHVWLNNSTPGLKAFRIYDDPDTTANEYGTRDASRDFNFTGGRAGGRHVQLPVDCRWRKHGHRHPGCHGPDLHAVGR